VVGGLLFVGFYKYSNIPFEQPGYRKVLRLPFIPLEREVDELISGVARKKTSCFLRLLKETGMRAGEGLGRKMG
jgi:integrase